MAFVGINYLAVLIAAVAAWVLGAVWYQVLSQPWLAAQGRTRRTWRARMASQNPTCRSFSFSSPN